jgi:hypothetical protein
MAQHHLGSDGQQIIRTSGRAVDKMPAPTIMITEQLLGSNVVMKIKVASGT